LRATRYLGRFLKRPGVQSFIQSRIPAGGPSEAERHRGKSLLWGEVTDSSGQRRTSRLHTMEGYDVTVRSSLEVVRRVLSGSAPLGFQTPAMAYGPDLALAVERTTLEDVD
jgi:saccharopine dehydrogenase (NAD+, L-lysine-forming)